MKVMNQPQKTVVKADQQLEKVSSKHYGKDEETEYFSLVDP